MNQLYNHIIGLRSIRKFQDRPLDEGDLRLILEAARWTGSAKNQQDWSIVAVLDPTQRDRLSECGNATGPLAKAPVSLVLVQEAGGYEFDTGRLGQNIMLAAAALDVASCPITLHRDQDAAQVLGLPADCRCRYAVALGYSATAARPARLGGRKPLKDLVHTDSYRTPS